MRRDTTANWTSANPTLAQGELGLDTTLNRFKIGDGTTAYNTLGYAPNTVFGGTGAPSGTLGVNGDIYFDTTSGATKLYGPKAAGSWGSGVTLTGATGTTGSTGPTGPGVPSSPAGTTGQVLVKNSATALDTAWANTPVDGATITITGNNVAGVPANGINTAQIAANAVGPTQLASVSVTNAKIAISATASVKGQLTGLSSVTDVPLTPASGNTAVVGNARNIATTAPLTGGGTLAADLTLAISAATVSAAGSMSAVDKLKENNIWVDMAAERGFVGDDATLNDTAWTAFLASPAPQGATLFFPAGTYRFANEITLNQDKRWKFKGAGSQATFFKTTSITANLFNFTVAGFYTTWEDMGFLTTAVKTAGAGIAITGANNSGCDMRRLSFNGMFIGIDLQGAQSGNVSVFDSLNYGAPPVNGRMLRINGNTINLVVQNSTSNCVPNAGAVAGTANIEVNQSGALQVIGCDLIGGINSLLLNANQGGTTSIAAIYVTNTFFDQSGGSTIKITGANTTNRVKFVQCGIAAGVIGGNAFEVAGTGTGGVGSPTAMPAGISLVDCDIYYAPGASTASGILVNGCQDINIQNTRLAGFSGAGGAGIHIIGSISNQTRVRINGCRIGPNSNLTINNTVGVQLDAGSSGLGALSITDNDIAGNGTAIVDSSPAVAGVSKFINNNLGGLSGLNNTIVSATGITIATTDTVIIQLPVPANAFKVGSTIRFVITGTSATATPLTFKAHIGPLGTTADPAPLSLAASSTAVAGGLVITGQFTVTVVGATATVQGAAVITAGTATNAPAVTATATFNTTVANIITLSALGGASGQIMRAAIIEAAGPA